MRLQEVCTFVTVPPTGGGLVLGIRRNRNRRRAHRGGGVLWPALFRVMSSNSLLAHELD